MFTITWQELVGILPVSYSICILAGYSIINTARPDFSHSTGQQSPRCFPLIFRIGLAHLTDADMRSVLTTSTRATPKIPETWSSTSTTNVTIPTSSTSTIGTKAAIDTGTSPDLNHDDVTMKPHLLHPDAAALLSRSPRWDLTMCRNRLNLRTFAGTRTRYTASIFQESLLLQHGQQSKALQENQWSLSRF